MERGDESEKENVDKTWKGTGLNQEENKHFLDSQIW